MNKLVNKTGKKNYKKSILAKPKLSLVVAMPTSKMMDTQSTYKNFRKG